jgi:ribonuclease BN (tRNA processing enzyme)
LKITVLGPWGAYPKAGEATAGYLLEHLDEKILVDCGSGVLAQLQKYIKLSEITAVIISHTHFDHIADLGCLQYACLIDQDLGIRTSTLPIYMADEANDNKFKEMAGTEIRRISVEEALVIKRLRFTFFKTFHGAFCLAMKIQYLNKTIVYTADTYYDETLVDFCANADALIAETSFNKAITDAKKYGHMNTTDVGTLAMKARIGKAFLTHLPHFGDLDQLAGEVAEVFKGEIERVYCGMEIEL